MTNILFISPSSHWGGAEKSLYLMLKKINRNKYCPLVALPGEGILERKIKKLGIETVHVLLRDWMRHKYSAQNIQETRKFFLNGLTKRVYQLYKFVKERDIKFIFTNTGIILEGALVAGLSGAHHFWYLHEFLECNEGWRFVMPRRFCFYLMNQLTSNFFVCSQVLRDGLPQFKSKKPIVIYPVFDDLQIENPRQRTGKKPVVAFVGQPQLPSKGFLDFVDAAIEVMRAGLQPKFHVIGSLVEDISKWELLLKEKGILDFFSIYQFSEDVEMLLSDCDIIVSASDIETFSLSVYEAMVFKKAVIATRSGGPQELILDGESGYLVPVKNKYAMAEKMITLILNPDERKRMGEKAYERVCKNFNPCQQIKKIEEVIDGVRNEKKSMLRQFPSLINGLLFVSRLSRFNMFFTG